MRTSLRDTARPRGPMSSVAPFVASVAAAFALLAAPTAHAGLLEDDEARKAILDLRTKVADNDAAARRREAELQSQLQSQIEQLQKALLDLSNQNETLRADIARLRGQNEQLARDLSDMQRKQKDIVQGVDDRLKKVEPQKVSQDGKDFMADPEEKLAFDDAMGGVRGGDFDKAVNGFGGFLRRWPASGYADSARFWLGNAQYAKRDFKGALVTLRAFLAAAPDHPRAPEALLAVANCQVETKDVKAAKKTLAEVVATYPKSEAAQAARERLATLK